MSLGEVDVNGSIGRSPAGSSMWCYAPLAFGPVQTAQGQQLANRHSSQLFSLVCVALLCGGCETPINDADLPPPAEPEVIALVEEEGAVSSSSSDGLEDMAEPGEVEAPDDGDATLDAVAAQELGPEADVLADVMADDALVTSCDADHQCRLYWETYSACLVQVGGAGAAIDSDFYSEECASTCALADMLDYVGYYTCLIEGVPDDCAVDGVVVPDCQL